MTTDLVKQLRKLSAENPSPRDCIDVAADELERLCTENANLKREAWTWSKACETATKQLEPVRVDAARYRWLKGRPWVKTNGIHAWGALLDDAIDEARHDAPDETPNVHSD